MANQTMKISVIGLGLAIGVIWGVALLLVGLLAAYAGYGVAFTETFGSIYIGFQGTFGGSILGAIWGFIDGFIFGALVAWLYNVFSSCCCKKGDDNN